MSNRDEGGDEDRTHLNELDGSMGCTEIWEKLSEQREESGDAAAADD